MIQPPIQKAGKAFEFTSENTTQVEKLKTKYPDTRSLTLPCLWMIQQQQGWVSLESLEYLEKILSVPKIHFYETVSFYVQFRLKPNAKHEIRLCKTLPCELRGSLEIKQVIMDELGIKHGETTEDGMFSFLETECLGYCDKAPVMLVSDETQYADLTAEKTKQIIKELSGQ